LLILVQHDLQHKCSVVNCKSNYNGQEIVSVTVMHWKEIVFNDCHRAVQTPSSASATLQMFAKVFKGSNSGHGATRCQCLIHDTKKALVQTMEGLVDLCQHLFSVGFQYIWLSRDWVSITTTPSHHCSKVQLEDALEIECLFEIPLSTFDSSAYVAGWLEKKSSGLLFEE
jgi:hypothetical protein